MAASTCGAATDRPAESLDTFPKLLLSNVERFGDQDALREKEYGIWQVWTWRQLADQVRIFACGLAELGFRRGDRLAVIGDNRPRLYAAMTAAQSLGGIPVPMYQNAVAKELEFVLEHAEARFVVAENQEQVDKLLDLKASAQSVETIIYVDPRGLRHYEHAYLRGYHEVEEKGRQFDEAHPEFWRDEVAKGAGDDVAIMLYTSGTTGNPKGVVLTHRNLIVTARNAAEFERLSADDSILAYLPMAWVGDNIFSVAQSYITGFCVNCPESSDTVMHDLRETGPTFFFAPPAIYENLLTTVMIRMEDAGAIKRRMFQFFMSIAKQIGVKVLERRSVGLKDRLLYAIGEFLVYGPLKNTLGLSRVRLAYTAGEAIGPDIFDFYRSIGINMKQLYGQTEASVFITIQPDGEIKPDTVGRPVADVELKVDENGEVLYRSPGVFREYFKNPQATSETKTADGWVHTGDAGLFDGDGHLKIIDRAKDVGRLNGGSLFAPKYIENKLKFFPHVKEAVTFGNERDCVTAFINIDLESVGNWAEKRNIAYGSYQELAANPAVLDLVQECIAQVNADLAADPELAGAQIRRFLNLHKELDADDGELTRTRKVRRRIIAERYAPLIDALYSGAHRCHVDTDVTFEDGRTGVISADLEIRDVEMVEPLAKAS